ncbi:RNA methyltransferase [Candidatus Saccharibacteria bacterium]|nr:RNA methyltransferase [Candidatus Saccharibacteria bacterium]
MPNITVIAHNIRSTHNIGSIIRTCEGFGVSELICSGYTPYPLLAAGDKRLPHIANKLTLQIHKTALGAEKLITISHYESLEEWRLAHPSTQLIGLELNENSVPLSNLKPSSTVALLLGEEVNGISAEHLELCDTLVEIPMKGQKESFNVSVAAGIALYKLAIEL